MKVDCGIDRTLVLPAGPTDVCTAEELLPFSAFSFSCFNLLK